MAAQAVDTPSTGEMEAGAAATASEPMAGTAAVATDTESMASLIGGMDPTMLLLSLLVPLLLIAVIFCRGSRSSGRKLVLFGPVGGGKTAIYHRLRYGRTVPTVSSMQPMGETFVPVGGDTSGQRPAHVVDVPGSGRVRAQLLEESSTASALVCVIDGTQLAAQAREAAGMIFEVLSHDSIVRRKLPVLIAVNKVDCAGAATVAAARRLLEQEIQRVRLARTTMQDTSGNEKVLRGIADDSSGATFSFEQINQVVSFAETSATKPQLDAILGLF